MCQLLRPAPPLSSPSSSPPPPPRARISPKCWRSLTRMFNSFQKHCKAICRREAPTLRCLSLRAAPRRPGPLPPGPRPASPCPESPRIPRTAPRCPPPSCAASPAVTARHTHVGASETKPAPLSSPTPGLFGINVAPLSSPLYLFFFPFPPSPLASGK